MPLSGHIHSIKKKQTKKTKTKQKRNKQLHTIEQVCFPTLSTEIEDMLKYVRYVHFLAYTLLRN